VRLPALENDYLQLATKGVFREGRTRRIERLLPPKGTTPVPAQHPIHCPRSYVRLCDNNHTPSVDIGTSSSPARLEPRLMANSYWSTKPRENVWIESLREKSFTIWCGLSR
jgi:hypothetical protein